MTRPQTNIACLDRRAFTGGMAQTALLLGGGLASCNARTDHWLLEAVPGGSGLRKPTQLGVPTEREIETLQTFYRQIGVAWQWNEASETEPQARDFLMVKSTAAPSYREEYKEAAILLDRLIRETTVEEACARALTPVDAKSGNTRLGRMQRWVGSELITWRVSQGGFVHFGYMNYRGFPGGPFTGADILPYRPRAARP